MWFYTSLLTSAVMAVSVIFNKRLIRNVSALVLTWATLALSTPIILLFAIKSLFKNRASFLMMIAVLLNSIGIVFDKLAINNTIPKNTTFTLLLENLMVIFGLLPVLYLRNKHFPHQIFSNAKLFLLLGLLNAATTMLAFSSAGGGDIGLVATLFKTNILLVLLFSYLIFKDRPKREILIGSAIMIAGVVL